MGPDHPQVADVLAYLGILYLKQGKYAEAEQLYQQALRIREQQWDRSTPIRRLYEEAMPASCEP